MPEQTYKMIRARFLLEEKGKLSRKGKMKFKFDPNNPKYGRPKRIIELTEVRKAKVSVKNEKTGKHEDKYVEREVIVYKNLIYKDYKAVPGNVEFDTHKFFIDKGTGEEIKVEAFITEWEGGPTPSPKPIRNCTDEFLLDLGWSYEQINKARERTWRATDVKRLSKRLRVTLQQARELLEKHGSVSRATLEVDPQEIEARREQSKKDKRKDAKRKERIKKLKGTTTKVKTNDAYRKGIVRFKEDKPKRKRGEVDAKRKLLNEIRLKAKQEANLKKREERVKRAKERIAAAEAAKKKEAEEFAEVV